MDSTPPVAVSCPYPSRRGWLIAFGVIEILMACGFLLLLVFSAFMFFGPAAARMPPNAMAAGPFSKTTLMAFVSLQYGLMAAVFIAAGIGSIRCKNWARILMIVISILWLVCGLLGTLMMAFLVPVIMRQQPGNVPPGIQHVIIVGMIACMSIFMVLLPATFLFFYTRKSVRATCLGQNVAPAATIVGGGAPSPRLPVPLAILAVWEALSALSVLAILIIPATLVFGVVIRGLPASLIFLAHSLLSAYAAWTIYRQQLIGWTVSLFKIVFWTVSALVTALRRPDMAALFREMGYNDQTLLVYQQFPRLLPMVWVGTAVMMTVVIVFILYARKSFPAEVPE
jgi:hypothetical protein